MQKKKTPEFNFSDFGEYQALFFEASDRNVVLKFFVAGDLFSFEDSFCMIYWFALSIENRGEEDIKIHFPFFRRALELKLTIEGQESFCRFPNDLTSNARPIVLKPGRILMIDKIVPELLGWSGLDLYDLSKSKYEIEYNYRYGKEKDMVLAGEVSEDHIFPTWVSMAVMLFYEADNSDSGLELMLCEPLKSHFRRIFIYM